MIPRRMIALIVILAGGLALAGCSETNSGMSDEAANITDESVQQGQSDYEKISAASSVHIYNVIEDGTFWAIVTDEIGQTSIVHTNVDRDILGSMEKSAEETMQGGISDTLFVVRQDNEYKIYDINSHEDISDSYKSDYDTITSYMETEDSAVFGVRKVYDSFEEQYVSFKLVDTTGKEFFEIPLDSKSLMDNYGIEKNYLTEDVNISYAGNNVYYIKYVASQFRNDLNALVVDLNRNKVIPAAFPRVNGSYLCTSDGNYTIAYTQQYNPIMVDHELGAEIEFPNPEYVPMQKISDGVFYATGRYNGNASAQVFLNLSGEVVIDLNQYPQEVVSVYPFKDGAAFVRFRNNYVTFIDLKGEFLFEPIKGHLPEYIEDSGIAIMYDESYEEGGRKIVSIDRNGNTSEINLVGDLDDFMLIEYEGEKYWVCDGEAGLQVQKYEDIYTTH